METTLGQPQLPSVVTNNHHKLQGKGASIDCIHTVQCSCGFIQFNFKVWEMLCCVSSCLDKEIKEKVCNQIKKHFLLFVMV